MHYTVSELATILSADTNERLLVSSAMEYAEVDSRAILHPSKTVFFALKGSRQDGHDFIPELIASGVKVFVVCNLLVKSTRCPNCLATISCTSQEAIQYPRNWHYRQQWKNRSERMVVYFITGKIQSL